MAGDVPDDHYSLYPFLSLVREVAADAAAQPDPDTCLRHLPSGLIRLGFLRAGVWVTDPDDSGRSRGTWGTDWDGSEFDVHSVTKPNQEIPGAVQIGAGERVVMSRVAKPTDAAPPPHSFIMATAGPPNQATVALRADGRLLGLISVDMLPSDGIIDVEHLAALELVADVVAVAVARGRLVDRLTVANEELRAASERNERELTERKQAETALRETEQRLSFLVEVTGNVLYRMRYDSMRFDYASSAIEKLTGYTPAEINAGAWFRMIQRIESPSGQVRPLPTGTHEILVGEAAVYHAMYLIKTKSGAERWLEDRSEPWLDEAGNVIGAMGMLSDITERRLLEEQFRQSQKMEAIGQLAGGVAHDFNNLLTVIGGYCELLLDQLAPTTREHGEVRQILLASESAASLTSQLLAFSRRQVIAPKETDLNLIVNRLSTLLRRLIGEDITYATVLASNLGLVRADVGQIEQILLNLATNARDAMPRGGTLTIETRNVDLGDDYVRHFQGARVGAHVMIAVADTGIGMDAATQAHLFEPFFTTKEVGRGTGLGLAAVYGIVTQSGGSIEVSSDPGQGSTFRLYFPRVHAAVDTGSAPEPRGKLPRGTETILLVEDERPVRLLARLALEASGYTVLEAAEGESALRMVEEQTGEIDLLVTDVVMPGMSGRVVAQNAVSQRPNLKVLYVSGYTDDIVVRHGVIGAGVAFLQKPFTPSTLTQKVRDVLDAPRSG